MTFRAAALVALFASLPFAFACTGNVVEPEIPVPGHEPALEVGTGDSAFDALGPGVDVGVQYGFQGGTHIWFAARAKNLGDDAALVYSITTPDGEVVSEEQTVMLPGDAGDDGWRTIYGLTAFIDGDVGVSTGMKVIFHGHVEDAAGHTLEATGEATVEGSAEPSQPGGWDNGF